MVGRDVGGIGDVLDGDEFILRPVVHDEGAAVGGGVEAKLFCDDTAICHIVATEDGDNGLRLDFNTLSGVGDIDVGEFEDGGEEIDDVDELIGGSGDGDIGASGKEGDVDASFVERSFGAGNSSRRKLSDLTGGTVVADDDDVGFAEID